MSLSYKTVADVDSEYTVKDLKALFDEHDIEYPKAGRKSVYIDIYIANIAKAPRGRSPATGKSAASVSGKSPVASKSPAAKKKPTAGKSPAAKKSSVASPKSTGDGICECTVANGDRCKNPAKEGSQFCWRHQACKSVYLRTKSPARPSPVKATSPTRPSPVKATSPARPSPVKAKSPAKTSPKVAASRRSLEKKPVAKKSPPKTEETIEERRRKEALQALEAIKVLKTLEEKKRKEALEALAAIEEEKEKEAIIALEAAKALAAIEEKKKLDALEARKKKEGSPIERMRTAAERRRAEALKSLEEKKREENVANDLKEKKKTEELEALNEKRREEAERNREAAEKRREAAERERQRAQKEREAPASPVRSPVKKGVGALRMKIKKGEDVIGSFDELLFTHNIPLPRFTQMVKTGPVGLVHTNNGAQFRYGIDSQYGEIIFVMDKDFLNSFVKYLDCKLTMDGIKCLPSSSNKPVFWNPLVEHKVLTLEETAEKFTFRPTDFFGTGYECDLGAAEATHRPTWCNQQVHIDETVPLSFVSKVLVPNYLFRDEAAIKVMVEKNKFDIRDLNTMTRLPNGDINPLQGKVVRYGPDKANDHYSYISLAGFNNFDLFYEFLDPSVYIFGSKKPNTIRGSPSSSRIFISPEAFLDAEKVYMNLLIDAGMVNTEESQGKGKEKEKEKKTLAKAASPKAVSPRKMPLSRSSMGTYEVPILDVMKSYIGLYTTINWKNDKTYLSKCELACDDDVFETERKKINIGNLKKLPPTGKSTKKCQTWMTSDGSAYSPIDCLKNFNPGAVFVNKDDGNDYILMETVKCLSRCDLYSHIFRKDKTNEYYVIFSTGSIVETFSEHITMLIDSLLFINQTLDKYIKVDNKIFICGHSSGLINALIIAQVFAMDIDRLIRYFNCDWETDVHCYTYKKSDEYNMTTAHMAAYNLPVDPTQTAKIREAFDKFNQLKDEREDIIRNNISFVGSGGHMIFNDLLCPFERVYQYFKHKPINFCNFDDSSKFYDIFCSVGPSKIQYFGTMVYNTPLMHIKPNVVERVKSFIDYTPKTNNHEFRFYINYLKQLYTDTEAVASLKKYYDGEVPYVIPPNTNLIANIW